MERRRSIAISDDDSRDDESRVNTNNISSSTSAEAVIRYLDYRSQASERKKELDTLRERCIANSRASLLSLASVPKDSGSTVDEFFRNQRALSEVDKRLRKEAQDINNLGGIHNFDHGDPPPPPEVPYPTMEEQLQTRKTETSFFMDRYLAAKESIVKQTELFWKAATTITGVTTTTTTTSPQELSERDENVDPTKWTKSTVASSKLWDSTAPSSRSQRGMSSRMTTDVDISDSPSDEQGKLEDSKGFIPFDQQKALPVLWFSLMAMCSTNMLGLVLSLALINYNLRLEKINPQELTSLLADGRFFALCRLIFHRLQAAAQQEKELDGTFADDDENDMDCHHQIDHDDLRDTVEGALQVDSNQLIADTVMKFHEALLTFQNKENSSSTTTMTQADELTIHQQESMMEDIPYIATMLTMPSFALEETTHSETIDEDQSGAMFCHDEYTSGYDNLILEKHHHKSLGRRGFISEGLRDQEAREGGPEVLVYDNKKSELDGDDQDPAFKTLFHGRQTSHTSRVSFMGLERESSIESRDVHDEYVLESHPVFDDKDERDREAPEPMGAPTLNWQCCNSTRRLSPIFEVVQSRPWLDEYRLMNNFDDGVSLQGATTLGLSDEDSDIVDAVKIPLLKIEPMDCDLHEELSDETATEEVVADQEMRIDGGCTSSDSPSSRGYREVNQSCVGQLAVIIPEESEQTEVELQLDQVDTYGHTDLDDDDYEVAAVENSAIHEMQENAANLIEKASRMAAEILALIEDDRRQKVESEENQTKVRDETLTLAPQDSPHITETTTPVTRKDPLVFIFEEEEEELISEHEETEPHASAEAAVQEASLLAFANEVAEKDTLQHVEGEVIVDEDDLALELTNFDLVDKTDDRALHDEAGVVLDREDTSVLVFDQTLTQTAEAEVLDSLALIDSSAAIDESSDECMPHHEADVIIDREDIVGITDEPLPKLCQTEEPESMGLVDQATDSEVLHLEADVIDDLQDTRVHVSEQTSTHTVEAGVLESLGVVDETAESCVPDPEIEIFSDGPLSDPETEIFSDGPLSELCKTEEQKNLGLVEEAADNYGLHLAAEVIDVEVEDTSFHISRQTLAQSAESGLFESFGVISETTEQHMTDQEAQTDAEGTVGTSDEPLPKLSETEEHKISGPGDEATDSDIFYEEAKDIVVGENISFQISEQTLTQTFELGVLGSLGSIVETIEERMPDPKAAAIEDREDSFGISDQLPPQACETEEQKNLPLVDMVPEDDILLLEAEIIVDFDGGIEIGVQASFVAEEEEEEETLWVVETDTQETCESHSREIDGEARVEVSATSEIEPHETCESPSKEIEVEARVEVSGVLETAPQETCESSSQEIDVETRVEVSATSEIEQDVEDDRLQNQVCDGVHVSLDAEKLRLGEKDEFGTEVDNAFVAHKDHGYESLECAIRVGKPMESAVDEGKTEELENASKEKDESKESSLNEPAAATSLLEDILGEVVVEAKPEEPENTATDMRKSEEPSQDEPVAAEALLEDASSTVTDDSIPKDASFSLTAVGQGIGIEGYEEAAAYIVDQSKEDLENKTKAMEEQRQQQKEENKKLADEVEKARRDAEEQARVAADEAARFKREKELEEMARRKAEEEREEAREEARQAEAACRRAEEETARLKVEIEARMEEEIEARMAETAQIEAKRLADILTGDDAASQARLSAAVVLRKVQEAEDRRSFNSNRSPSSGKSVSTKSVTPRASHNRKLTASSFHSTKLLHQSSSSQSEFYSCGANPGSICSDDYLTIYMHSSDGGEEGTFALSELSKDDEYDIATTASFSTQWSSGTRKYIFESTPAFAKHAKTLHEQRKAQMEGSDDAASKESRDSGYRLSWTGAVGVVAIVGCGTTIALSPKYRQKIASFDPKVVLGMVHSSILSVRDNFHPEQIVGYVKDSLSQMDSERIVSYARITLVSIREYIHPEIMKKMIADLLRSAKDHVQFREIMKRIVMESQAVAQSLLRIGTK